MADGSYPAPLTRSCEVGKENQVKHIEIKKPMACARLGRIFSLPRKRGRLGEEEQP